MFKKVSNVLITFRFRRVFLCLLALTVVGFWLCGFHRSTTHHYPWLVLPKCFTEEGPLSRQFLHELLESYLNSSGTVKILEDVLRSTKKPTLGKTIFFHETGCSLLNQSSVNETLLPSMMTKDEYWNKVDINGRQACAIESAAYHNPNSDVFVLFTSLTFLDNSASNAVLKAMLSYPNVHLRNLNLWTYAADTPIYDVLQNGKLFRSSYVVVHTSDFLRLVTLWRWGGTYLDMDTITLQNMETVPPNYVGAQLLAILNSAVMNFEPTGFGHDVVQQCLEDFREHFDGEKWTIVGPTLITRVMAKLCKTENISLMMDHPKRCSGFRVFGLNAFYEVPWLEWYRFFEEQYVEDTLERTKNSYLVHMWNKMSVKRPVKKGSNVAYSRLAEKHCPKVYAALGEYF